MKHKRFLILVGLAAVTALAIFAVGAAFGWWYTDAAPISGNTVASGTATLTSGGGPMSATNLVPQATPADNDNDIAYGGVSYYWVKNTGSVPLMFYAYIDNGGGAPSADFLAKVNVRIWLLGATSTPSWWSGLPGGWSPDTFNAAGPWAVWSGTLADLWNGGTAFGIAHLASVTPSNTATPINQGEVGIYRVAVWLDSTAAAPDTQGQTASFSLEFHAIQLQQWQTNGGHF